MPHNKRRDVAVQALADLRLRATLCEQHLHGRSYIRFLTTGYRSKTVDADELRTVGAQERVDLDWHGSATQHVADDSAQLPWVDWLEELADEGGIRQPWRLLLREP
jgi:hypothetical protein